MKKNAWNQDVDVYWQCNTWADTKVSFEWVKGTLSKSVQGLDRFALFSDNLKSQESDELQSAAAALNGVAWFGLKNAADLWQVVDASLARNWLDKEGNADRLYGNENIFTTSERQILITHWVGEAQKKLCSPDYDHFRKRCWEKTGFLITADGSEDDKITPEGLPSYKVPSLVDYVHAAETLSTPNQPTVEDGTTEEDNENADQDADGQDEPSDNGEEWEDHEDDRIIDAPYCGR